MKKIFKPLEIRKYIKLGLPFFEPKYNSISQFFGINKEIYQRFKLLGHNGLDFAVPLKTPIRAVCDGFVKGVKISKDGYGIYIRQFSNWVEIENEKICLDIVYGHLDEALVKSGQKIKKGKIIGFVDNTGFSTGNHLHLGVRLVTSYNNKILEYNNGYFGYIDPYLLLEDKITAWNYTLWKRIKPEGFEKNELIEDFENFPIDNRYGQTRTWDKLLKEKTWAFNPWLRKKINRLPTNREIIMGVYGYWDFESIFQNKVGNWTLYYTKPEYLSRIKKKLGLKRKEVEKC